jgi:hypothetical protein
MAVEILGTDEPQHGWYLDGWGFSVSIWQDCICHRCISHKRETYDNPPLAFLTLDDMREWLMEMSGAK